MNLLYGLLLLLLTAPAAAAQSAGAQRATSAQPTVGRFEGRIQDARTQAPVPFASVSLLGSALGVVSNAEGQFSLAVPAGHTTDSVIVNCLGYAPSRLRLSPPLLAAPQVLRLQPRPVQLQEVAVTGYTPESLLKQAVRTTHARLLSPVLLKSYYRELVQINGTFFKFADGLVDFRLAQNPRRPNRPDVQVRVRESRAQELRKAVRRTDDIISVLDVEQAIIGYERDSDVRSNFLDSADFSFFKYELRTSSAAEEEPFYAISFTPLTHDEKHLQQGTVRINRQTLCIQSIDSEIPAALGQYGQSVRLLGVRVQLNSIRKHLEYRQLAQGCYLGFLRLEFGVEVQAPRQPLLQYNFSSAMMVTDLVRDPPPIARAEQYRGGPLYKNGTRYQRPYWQEGNILPTTPEEQAALAEMKNGQ